MVKELVINGITFAKYLINGDTLSLKLILPKHDFFGEIGVELMAVAAIQLFENNRFDFVTHLNID